MNTAFTNFMNTWNGKYCEVSGSSAKNQCVDLANAYIRDVLHLPIIEWTNATDFPSKAGDKYDYILNSKDNVPLEGDIIVWNGAIGHIAIFIEGNVNRFISFDQNYPTYSPCHIQGHTYANVKGWLRLKNTPPPVIINPPTNVPMSPHAQSRKQIIIDTYQALTGHDPSSETLAWREQQNLNTRDLMIDMLTNDGEVRTKWSINTQISLTNFTDRQLLQELLNRA